MSARRLATLVAALAGLVPAGAARADAPVERARSYLVAAQNADGGFGSAPRAASSTLFGSWAAVGLAAAGAPDERLRAWLETQPVPAAPGDAERLILALRALGAPAPEGLVARVTAAQRADGSIGGLANLTAFGVLALRASGRPASDSAVRRAAAWLARQQNRDGGFSFSTRGGRPGTDETAAALQALRAAGRSRHDSGVTRAARYLLAQQRRDGGFGLAPGALSNAQSTSFAIQGLVASGRSPAQRRPGRSRSALGYLRSLQAADGSVRYSRTSRQTPVWVTAQALPALARRPLPGVPRR